MCWMIMPCFNGAKTTYMTGCKLCFVLCILGKNKNQQFLDQKDESCYSDRRCESLFLINGVHHDITVFIQSWKSSHWCVNVYDDVCVIAKLHPYPGEKYVCIQHMNTCTWILCSSNSKNCVCLYSNSLLESAGRWDTIYSVYIKLQYFHNIQRNVSQR